MEAEDGQDEAHVGNLKVSASIMPELEAYVILLALMLQADKNNFAEVCKVILATISDPAISKWSCHWIHTGYEHLSAICKVPVESGDQCSQHSKHCDEEKLHQSMLRLLKSQTMKVHDSEGICELSRFEIISLLTRMASDLTVENNAWFLGK